jgi:sugar phosphate isomerase/epimerase
MAAIGQAAQSRRPVRWAICNETFEGWPFEKACATAVECGYNGLEVAPFTLASYVTEISAERRKELRRQAERAHIEIIGLHWLLAKTEGFLLTSPDASVRRKTADYLSALTQFCADLGGKVLVFGSPKQRNLLPGVTRDQGMDYATEVLHAVLPVLEKTGVVMALEPLTPQSTNFLSCAADGVELMNRVASPCCRLHLDCRSMSSESTPIPDLLRTYRTQLAHFHANDPNGLGPGFGKLDFVPIFRALREIDYSGWVSVEVFDFKLGGDHLARESIRYMKKCLARADA